MLEVAVVVVVAFLLLSNGGWDWLKTKFAALKTQTNKDLEPVSKDVQQLGSDIHAMIDNWLALCQLPDLANDPEAVKAMEVLKAKILGSALPKPKQ